MAFQTRQRITNSGGSKHRSGWERRASSLVSSTWFDFLSWCRSQAHSCPMSTSPFAVLDVNQKAPPLSTPPLCQNSLRWRTFQNPFPAPFLFVSFFHFSLACLFRWWQERHEKNVCIRICHFLLLRTPLPPCEQPRPDSGGRETM